MNNIKNQVLGLTLPEQELIVRFKRISVSSDCRPPETVMYELVLLVSSESGEMKVAEELRAQGLLEFVWVNRLSDYQCLRMTADGEKLLPHLRLIYGESK